jgi:ornithine carbamoyltransferase
MDRTDPPSGWRSAIYDEAENRMHAQKAVMTLLMGGK